MFQIMGNIGKQSTNNTAEYSALILSLAFIHLLGIKNKIIVIADSELVCRQVTGEYKTSTPHIHILSSLAKALLAQFKNIEIKHVLREYNSVADDLANKAKGLPNTSLVIYY